MLRWSIIGLALIGSAAAAEPIGRWFSGFGQGTLEYGIKNDSAGSDYFYIACPSGRGAEISVTVGGVAAPPRKSVIVTIGADEFELYTDAQGEFTTSSRVGHDTFEALWAAMRRGSAMRVRLANGQSTAFTLRGAAKVLPQRSCKTGFADF